MVTVSAVVWNLSIQPCFILYNTYIWLKQNSVVFINGPLVDFYFGRFFISEKKVISAEPMLTSSLECYLVMASTVITNNLAPRL